MSKTKIHRLILYRQLLGNNLIKKYQDLLRRLNLQTNQNNAFLLENELFDLYSLLIEHAQKEAYGANLWKNFISSIIVQDENVFSLACEQKHKTIDNSLHKLAIYDIKLLKELFHFDWLEMGQIFNIEVIDFMFHYRVEQNVNRPGKYATMVGEFYSLLDSNAKDQVLVEYLIDFYQTLGCGQIAKYKAFSWQDGLIGIDNPDKITFEDLIGYEYQKQILMNNTEAFLNRRKGNNVLLYGDKGTGKSSSIKALLNKYHDKGLRIVEITKDQLTEFKSIIKELENRNPFFIVFIDDLSFEDFEVEYKNIKAMIEGSIEAKPDNVLLYVTSNRRHLIKENWDDRRNPDKEIHTFDSQQEKLSFADRFGITITYQSPNQREYLQIVQELAKKDGIKMPEEELKQKAIQWEMRYHGRSGRSARQFIDHLVYKHS